ncbi:MAG: hypothetical protein PHF05_06380 [Candidatus Izemoplasmatales bacterium]|nr:hypothetical protein [Candidatus Izemoplasmatales bacterium]
MIRKQELLNRIQDLEYIIANHFGSAKHIQRFWGIGDGIQFDFKGSTKELSDIVNKTSDDLRLLTRELGYTFVDTPGTPSKREVKKSDVLLSGNITTTTTLRPSEFTFGCDLGCTCESTKKEKQTNKRVSKNRNLKGKK